MAGPAVHRMLGDLKQDAADVLAVAGEGQPTLGAAG